MTNQDIVNARWGPVPRRESLWVGGLVVVTFALIAGLLVWALQEDRDAMVATVEQQRMQQVDTVVDLVTQDVNDVVDDLKFIVRIAAAGPERTRHDAVEALLAGIPAYRAAVVWTSDDSAALSVVDPRNEPPSAALMEVMLSEARRLGDDLAQLTVSPVIEVDGATYRVFGYRPRGGSPAVLAVETNAWLSGLRLVSSDPSNRILVLGPGGRVSPATDRELASHLTASNHPDLEAVLARMRSGTRGTDRLSAAAAATLGLDDAQVVVAYAPIRLQDGEFWSIATLTSVASLEAQENALTRRFALAMGGILLLFVGFGAHVVTTTRRTALLRERLEHAAQLADVNAQLLHAEKLATVGGVSAGIAHEVGTPLGVIRGRAEYVLRKLGEDHPQAPSLHTIVEQIDRVTRIIRELLDYSQPRPTSGKATDLAEVVEKTVGFLAMEFEKAGVAVDIALDDNLPPLQADPDHLQQVLVNLLVNARDACGPDHRVRILGSAVDRGIRIEVTDDGPGIPESYVNQIFDPFFTTKKRGHGTGLGLAVVSQIIRSHGGDVEIESMEGKGTTVRIYWPRAT